MADVGAGDEQDDRRNPGKPSRHVALERGVGAASRHDGDHRDRHRPVAVVELDPPILHHRRRALFRDVAADSPRQPPDDGEPAFPVVAPVGRHETDRGHVVERDPEVDCPRPQIRKTARQHPRDRVDVTVDGQLGADDIRFAAEVPSPEPVRNDRPLFSRLAAARRETAEPGRGLQHPEELVRHEQGVRQPGVAPETDGDRRVVVGGDGREGTAGPQGGDVRIVGPRDQPGRALDAKLHSHDLVGRRHMGRRAEQQRIHQREHRGVDADADGERADGEHRETGRPGQPPGGLPQLRPENRRTPCQVQLLSPPREKPPPLVQGPAAG